MKYFRVSLFVPLLALALLVSGTWAGAQQEKSTPPAKAEKKAEKAEAAHPEKVVGTVEGEVVCMKCYLTQKASGAQHVQCGTTCAKSGIPVGILDAKNGKVFTVLAPAPGLADLMGKKVRITGTQFHKGMGIAPDKIEVEDNGKWSEFKLPEAPM